LWNKHFCTFLSRICYAILDIDSLSCELMINQKSNNPSNNKKAIRGFDDYKILLGDLLRGERATKGKSLLNVQRDIKISAKYIAAIENTDLSVFESSGYIPGYVKSYAIYLEVDPEWAFQRFCVESGFEVVDALSLTNNYRNRTHLNSNSIVKQVSLSSRLTKFGSIERGFLDQIELRAFGSIAVLVVLIGALSFAGLTIFKQIQQVDFEVIDGDNLFNADLDSDLKRKTVRVNSINNQLVLGTKSFNDDLERKEVLEQPIFQSQDSPIGGFVKNKISNQIQDEIKLALTAVSNNLTNSTSFSRPQLRPSVQVTKRVLDKIVIFSLKPAYIRVAEENGTILFSKILDPGEYFSVPSEVTLPLLRAGMSGYVYFRVNGKEYGPVGSGPGIEKDIKIIRGEITKNYALADLTKDPESKKIIAKLDLKLKSSIVAED